MRLYSLLPRLSPIETVLVMLVDGVRLLVVLYNARLLVIVADCRYRIK